MILLISSLSVEDLQDGYFQMPEGDPIPVDSFFMISQRVSEYRCDECDKLLSKPNDYGIIAGEIKCQRCKKINRI